MNTDPCLSAFISGSMSFQSRQLGFAIGTLRWLLGKEIVTYANIRDSVTPNPAQT
jgi:hypothetical protein